MVSTPSRNPSLASTQTPLDRLTLVRGFTHGDEGPIPGPYRVETPCGERLLGFMTPLHADQWLAKHCEDASFANMPGQIHDVVRIGELWCILDPHAGTPAALAAEALHPLFQELYAIYARIGELENMVRSNQTKVEDSP